MSAITHLYAGVAVADLEGSIDCLGVRRIDNQAVETYSNRVGHVKIPDPDGNVIAFADPPDAA